MRQNVLNQAMLSRNLQNDIQEEEKNLKCKSAKQECMEADYEVQMYRT
jgi:hypothetical protein